MSVILVGQLVLLDWALVEYAHMDRVLNRSETGLTEHITHFSFCMVFAYVRGTNAGSATTSP